MKDIVIVGLNDFSKKVIKSIFNNYNIKVILDDLTNEIEFNGIKIDRIENANKYSNNSEIYVLDDMPYFDESYGKLYKSGINKIHVDIKENGIVDGLTLNDKAIHTYCLNDKPLLRYIEVHVSDRCNLKCNGCTHFSNITDEEGVDINSFKRDIDELKSKFDVSMVRLMGGEPFLCEDLDQYAEHTRKAFPNAIIFVVTNGILINKLSDKVINSIRENNIIVNISLYKPTLLMIDQIKKFVIEKGIKCRFGRGNEEPLNEDFIEKFHTCLSTEKNYIEEPLTCYNQYCWFLRDGYIYKCPYPALIDQFNKKYNLNFCINNDRIKLNNIIDGWKVIDFLSHKTDFCEYCKKNTKSYVWGCNNPKLSDYIFESDEYGNIKN